MNIAIIEDHLMLAESLQHSLNSNLPDALFKIYITGETFIEHDFENWMPDIILTDISLAGMSGIDVLEKIHKEQPHPKFILMSAIVDVHTIKNAMRKGARGYLAKNDSLNEMLEAIDTVQKGGQYISLSLKDKLFAHMFTDDEIVMHLSPKEKEVLQKICAGSTRKEIAFDMKLSIHTVQQYSKSLMKKFKVDGVAELVVFAIQKGFYNPGSTPP